MHGPRQIEVWRRRLAGGLRDFFSLEKTPAPQEAGDRSFFVTFRFAVRDRHMK